MESDIEIARKAKFAPIIDIAKKLAISENDISAYGKKIAKIDLAYIDSLKSNPNSKLVLVTAINPTPAGEGKTTTTIGLGDALNLLGEKTIIALREPSLGPCFGVKGGATGGGYSQVLPMEEINLHFTGDFHAITAANNLLAAMIDNHIYWGNSLEIDTRRIEFKRALDMNDRALRNINIGLGGAANGFAREDGFDISVASEIMAIFCLATNLDDLTRRLGNILIAYRRDKSPIYARDIKAEGALSVLLANALNPNLVQTIEGTPTLVHGGPFANIAHGCNSVIATKAALKMADFIVTEAGFGADLGAEKFLDIKCRKAQIKPDAIVLVATIRALKMNGGVLKPNLSNENIDALKAGFTNLARHFENLQKFGIKPIIAINKFASDTDNEIKTLFELCENINAQVAICTHHQDGGKGAVQLAQLVKNSVNGENNFKPLYEDNLSIEEKITKIASEIYHASTVSFSNAAKNKLKEIAALGLEHFPVCIAKTQYSFSSNPNLLGAPSNHILEVKDLKIKNGAEFIVAICGDIMTMPGLPKIPAAENIYLNDGIIEGLF